MGGKSALMDANQALGLLKCVKSAQQKEKMTLEENPQAAGKAPYEVETLQCSI